MKCTLSGSKRTSDVWDHFELPTLNKDGSKSMHCLLCKEVLSYCETASSAPSERAFSSAGLTVTKLRNRLTGEHVQAINFLHMNEDVLCNFVYMSIYIYFFFQYTCFHNVAAMCSLCLLSNFMIRKGDSKCMIRFRFRNGHPYH